MSKKLLGREACPSCQARGEDSSGDNLAVYSNGVYCFACGYSGEKKKTKKKVKLELPPTIELVKGIPAKNIGFRATSAFNVVGELDENQEETGWTIFPYYNLEKELVGIKYRNFAEEKQTGKKAVIFEGSPDLWGLQLYDPSTHHEVILWEGETDALAGWLYNPGYLHLAVGGTGLVERNLRANAMFLRKFNSIYLGFDNDTAGREAVQVAIDLLPRYKTYVVKYTRDVKDVHELWELGAPAPVFEEMMRLAIPVSSQDLLTGDKLVESYEKYDDNFEKFGFVSTGHPSIDEMLGGGFSPAELVLLFGPTGIGKSTFAIDMAINAAFHLAGGEIRPISELREREGANVMWVGTEMIPVQNVRKMMEKIAGRRYLENGKRTISKEQRAELVELISERVVFYNAMTGVFERVLDSIVTAVHQFGVRVVFIDVLNDIDDNFSNWERAAEICRQLARLTQGDIDDNRPPITIVMVCHTKGEDITEFLSLSDIKGGSSVRQQATVALSIEGDRNDDDRVVRSQKKSRMLDADFNVTTVSFDRITRQYHEKQIRRSDSRDTSRKMGVRGSKDSSEGELRPGLVRRRKRNNP